MRPRILFGLVASTVLFVGCGSSTQIGTSATQATGVAGPSTLVSTAPPQTADPATLPHDQGFTVVGMQLKQDVVAGMFDGRVEVQNTGSKSHTAQLTFTFKQNGQVVGTANAFADTVAPGKIVTLDLVSTDRWNGGPVTYEFKVSGRH